MWVNILVCLLTHLIVGMSVSFDQSFSCYADSGNFTTNTTYAKNLDFILHSLPNNVSEHGGFFTVTVGQGSNKAYALGLCRGDLTSYVCHSCVKFTVDDLRARCPNQKEAVSWSSDPYCCDKGFQRLFNSQVRNRESVEYSLHAAAKVAMQRTTSKQLVGTVIVPFGYFIECFAF
ncbi:hypothetical protein Gotur_018828 [Gossypium turneri]